MTYKEKLKAITEKHGMSCELRKLNEEVYELIEVIIKERELTEKSSPTYHKSLLRDILEEYADVMVVLNHIKLHYNLNDDDIKTIMKAKIDRQCERDNINA